MAEEDDDDGFGEFTFASSLKYTQSPHPSLSINSLEFPINLAATTSAFSSAAVHDNGKDDDDEWGDFVETPPGSAASPYNTSSKTFDSFDLFSSNSLFQSECTENAGINSTRHVESEKTNDAVTQWVKPKGAIPLSIFGEFDEEEEEKSGVGDSHDKNIQDSRNVGKVNDRLKTSNDFDVLENMQVNDSSGFGLSRLSSNINSTSLDRKDAILGLDTVDLGFSTFENRNNSNTSVEFGNCNETATIENGLNSSSKDLTSSLDVLNVDLIGHSVSFNQLDTILISKPDKKSSMNDQNQLNVNLEDPKSNSNSMDFSFRKEDNLNLGSWGLDLSGVQSNFVTMSSDINMPNSYSDVPILNSNFGGKGKELHSSRDNDDDDDGWDFQDALSESVVSHGNIQVHSEVQQLSNAKSFSDGSVAVSNGSIDLHPLADFSFGSFAPSNGISSSPGNIFGLDSNASAASAIGVFSNTSLTYEQTNGSNGFGPSKEIEIYEADDDFGDFATALADCEPKPKAELMLHESADTNMPSSEFVNGDNGSINLFTLSNGSAVLFFQANGISNNTDKKYTEFHTEPSVLLKNEEVDDDYNLHTNSRKEKVCGEDADDRHLVVGSTASEEDFGEFTVAPANTSQTQEGMEIREKILSKALPLSVFGDKEFEIDDSLSIEDNFFHQREYYKRNDLSANSKVPINDLISQLYNQAVKTSSLDVKPSQSVSIASDSVMNASLIEGTNEVCGTSWGNKESFFEDSAACQSYPVLNGVSNETISPEVTLGICLDFYSRLNDELCQFINCHPKMLKKVESSSIFSGKDAEVETCIEEIQEAGTESGNNNAITREHLVDVQERRDFNMDKFVELLRQQELCVFESQYDLERRLSMAGHDISTASEVMEHVKTMLKILSLESLENILSYVSMWYKIINACALELRQGAQILGESLERNVQSQLLADVRGKRFVFGLCEVYRVAVVIGASTKLYKPWSFLSPESSNIFSRLEECHALWNSSGIKESILSHETDEDIVGLLDSIKNTSDLDEFALENHVLTHQDSLCRLSLLTPQVAPGMTMVTWENKNEREQFFVKIANLWANLVSADFPEFLLTLQAK